ncbi:hypothetical protein [Scytonema sp. NUACC26]|uniref:hypothetical protein n=1 Tax=Scytonema sp. NUACC26 TaxID=3140176 RepID=UPI0038B2D0F3
MFETITNNSNIQDNELILFAEVAESIAATSKRTEKAALLGDYFRKLCDTA